MSSETLRVEVGLQHSDILEVSYEEGRSLKSVHKIPHCIALVI